MFSIYRKNDAHLVGKKDVKKKKIVHSRSLNMKKIILLMSNFDNIKFVINGKYSKKIYENLNYYVSLVIFQTYKIVVLNNVHYLGGLL